GFLTVDDAAVRQGCVKISGLHRKAVHRGDGLLDLVRGFQGDLAAVGPVDFVAVVLGGVVAGGDADARAAAIVPHRPGQGGGGFQPGVQVGGDAVGRQHTGGLAGKDVALDAAVVADGRLFGQAGGVQVIGQALGGLADVVDVHPVGA